jgi:hypothetical protein
MSTLVYDGDLHEARQRFEAAYQEADQAGDVQALAEAALGLAIACLGSVRYTLDVAEPQSILRCTREGRNWHVALGRRSVRVEHRVGLLHLAVLVANPGQEIDAIELAAGVSALGTGTLSGQPVLDRVAIARYRDRLTQLREEIDRREAAGEPDRAAQAREERDWLESELAAAAGLGGRARRFPDNQERARIAVGKAIRRAVQQIDSADPVIGAHLSAAIRTGMRCAYLPR